MANTVRQQELEDEMQQEFAESVFAEELDFDTVPAELMEAFGEAVFESPKNLIEDDHWGFEGKKQELKR